MRLFIGIDLDAEYFSGLQEKVVDSAVRLSLTHSFHLTLKFLGDVDSSTKDKVVLALKTVKVSPMELTVDGIGVFPSTGDVRVVWVGLKEDSRLIKLQHDIDTALKDLFPLEKQWVAHVTLARVKDISDSKRYRKKLSRVPVLPKRFHVESFRLIESTLERDGPKYTDVAVFSAITN